MVVGRYEVFLVCLDPTVGSEIKKTRLCIVLSPDEMNQYISTVIIAPMTTKMHHYPTRVPVRFKEKSGWVVLDQMRTVDRIRLVKKLGKVDSRTVQAIQSVIQEMLVE